jgi:hypothetical protein
MSFGILSFGILSFDILSFDILSFDILSFDISDFNISDFDISDFEKNVDPRRSPRQLPVTVRLSVHRHSNLTVNEVANQVTNFSAGPKQPMKHF